MKNKKFILFAILLVFNISFILASPFYYNVTLNYNKGVIKITSVDVIVSNRNIVSDYGDYKIEQSGINKEIIGSDVFNIPDVLLVDYVDDNGTITGGETINLEEVNFDIYIPYNEKTKELVIYDKENKEVTRANVGIYSKETVVSNLISEKDKKEIKQEENNISKKTFGETTQNYWWILIIIILIVIALFLGYPYLKRKYKSEK